MSNGTGTVAPPRKAREFRIEDLIGPLTEVEEKNKPETLFAIGDVSLLRSPLRTSVVGAKKATELGLARAEKLARLLAGRGVVVVSGLAVGIDSAAHWGAIRAGGRTVGVVPYPLDVAYAQADPALRAVMEAEHLLLSQFQPGDPVVQGNWPLRNRTMALLTQATVIVEASDSSGSLSQGWEALRLGRRLFILESVAEDPNLSWPTEMLRYGATVLPDPELDETPGAPPSSGPRDLPKRLSF